MSLQELLTETLETEILVDVLSGDFSVIAKTESNVLVNCIVCLLGLRYTFSKQTSQLIGFVKY